MSLLNVLPLAAFPGFQWASVFAPEVQEIVTTINTEGLDALSSVPENETAWANRGTKVSPGVGIVKVAVRLPSSMQFKPFVYGGGMREYNSMDITASVVKISPWDLNYAWPMIWNAAGGVKIMTSLGGTGEVVDFMGVSGLAKMIVDAARAYKSQLVASLFYKGITSTSMGLTAEAFTIAQPGLPNGLPLFTNGTDTVQHYSHPFNPNSGRFKNLYEAYGSFATKFAASLVAMTQVPHPSLPNMTMGKQVTDVFGPTWMRDRFFAMATQTLMLQATGGGSAAAPSNPMAIENLRKYNADSFIGAAGFMPHTYWIVPALDNHPYFTANSSANMTTGPGGGPADMWINVAANDPTQTWAELGAPTKEFMPMIRLYGDGDPMSQSQRRVRLESDLDAGVAAGLPHFVAMFLGV